MAAIAADDAYFDDRWYFAPMGSYVLAEDERSTDDGIGAALALGKRITPRLELELRGQYLQYDAEDNRQVILGIPVGPAPEDVEITAGGVGASYFFMPSGRGLFAHADALFGDASLYNLGLGFDVGETIALRFEALYHIDDDAGVEEPQFNLGFRIPFGERRQPPPEPAPVRTVAPVATPPPPKPECRVPGPGQQVDLNGYAVGDVIVLHGVNFDFDKATLTAEAKRILDDVADALRQRPDITVEIAGHT
ncbi:MAG: OmpA family protein, partial [Gammaproteobacteria bacterium]